MSDLRHIMEGNEGTKRGVAMMFGVFHSSNIYYSNTLRYSNALSLYAQICIKIIDNITVIQMNSIKLSNPFVPSQHIKY